MTRTSHPRTGRVTNWRNPSFADWEHIDEEHFAEEADRYFLRVRDFYDSRARWHRRFYRASGLVAVVLGGMLPLVATASFGQKDTVVGVVGFVVATVTALRGFYRWDTSWILLRQTEISLSRRYFIWKASQIAHPDTQSRNAQAAELLQELINVRDEESKAFFKELPLPDSRVPPRE